MSWLGEALSCRRGGVSIDSFCLLRHMQTRKNKQAMTNGIAILGMRIYNISFFMFSGGSRVENKSNRKLTLSNSCIIAKKHFICRYITVTWRKVLLTTWADITELDPHTGIESEAPRSLHLPSRVSAEVVPPSELRVFCRRQMMAVGVLSSPDLTLVARFCYTNGASVIGTTVIVTAVIWGRIFHKDLQLGSRNGQKWAIKQTKPNINSKKDIPPYSPLEGPLGLSFHHSHLPPHYISNFACLSCHICLRI